MTALLDYARLRRRVAVSNTRWVVHHMTSIRVAIASLLAAAAMLAGGALVQHSEASVSHKVVVAGPITCCEDGAITG
jgi:hypothetical protein